MWGRQVGYAEIHIEQGIANGSWKEDIDVKITTITLLEQGKN